MSFQNAAPLSLPLPGNNRKAEKGGGGERAFTPPHTGGGGSGVGTQQVQLLSSCPSTPRPASLAPQATPSPVPPPPKTDIPAEDHSIQKLKVDP